MAVRVYSPINNPYADIDDESQWDYRDWPAGMTLAEMFPNQPITVSQKGYTLPYDATDVRWVDGDVLTVRPIPQVSAALGAAISGAAAGAGTVGSVGVGWAVGIGVGAAALSLGTSLLAKSKLDNKGTPEGADDRDNSITGIRNEVARFEPIPRLLGRMVYYPPIPMTAQSYVEVVNDDDENLRAYFILGYGPLDIGGHIVGEGYDKINEDTDLDDDQHGRAPLRLGETDIHEYNGVELEVGTPDQITLYKNQVIQQELGWQTHQDDDEDDDNSQVTYTTAPEAVSAALNFHGSIFSIDEDNGDYDPSYVEFTIEWRQTGSDGSWSSKDIKFPSDEDDRTNHITRETEHKEEFKIDFDDADQYDIRITRTGEWHKRSGDQNSDVTLTAMRSERDRKPFDVDNVVVAALKIRSSDQLNGDIDDFNVNATSVLQDHYEADWEYNTSRNPAWAFVSVLTDAANYKPLSLDDFDVQSFVDWGIYCRDNELYYDAVLDNDSTTLDRLQEIADAGYATWSIESDSKIRAVLEDVETPPVDLITPRNSWDYSTTLKAFDPPDALRVRYTDPIEWEKDEVLVYWDESGKEDAQVYESIDAPGCTNRRRAWKYGRRYLANMRLRSIQKHTYKTNFRHFDYGVGDAVDLAHDVISFGIAWGRVLDYETDGDSVTSITTDEILDADDSDKTYGIQIQTLDGYITTTEVESSDDNPKSISVTGSLDSEDIDKDSIFAFGELDKITTKLRVTSITPESQDVAEIECEPLAPEIAGVLDNDDGIPSPDDIITHQGRPEKQRPGVPVVYKVKSDGSVAHENDDGSLSYRLVAFVTKSPKKPKTDRVVVQIRKVGDDKEGELTGSDKGKWRERTADDEEAEFDKINPGDVYEVRAKAFSKDGRESSWSSVVEHEVTSRKPSKPDGVTLERGTFSIKLMPYGGTATKQYDFYRSQEDLSDKSDSEIEDDATKVGEGSSVDDTDLDPDTTYYYAIRSVNSYGESGFYVIETSTKNSPNAVLKALDGQLTDSQLSQDLVESLESVDPDALDDKFMFTAGKTADDGTPILGGIIGGPNKVGDDEEFDILIDADKFAIGDPTESADDDDAITYPFIFDTDEQRAYLKEALISELTIDKLTDAGGDFIVSSGEIDQKYTAADITSDNKANDVKTGSSKAVRERGADCTDKNTSNDVKVGPNKAIREKGADKTSSNKSDDVKTGSNKAVRQSGADKTSSNKSNDVKTGTNKAVRQKGADKTNKNTAKKIKNQGDWATASKLGSNNIKDLVKSGAISGTYMKNASVDTLQIAGDAVTVPKIKRFSTIGSGRTTSPTMKMDFSVDLDTDPTLLIWATFVLTDGEPNDANPLKIRMYVSDSRKENNVYSERFIGPAIMTVATSLSLSGFNSSITIELKLEPNKDDYDDVDNFGSKVRGIQITALMVKR